MAGIDAYNKLLLHCEGTDGSTTILDSATGKAVTAVGTAQIDTTNQKFNSASVWFDGNSDSLTLAASDDFRFSTNDFTIDFWVYPNNFTNEMGIADALVNGGVGSRTDAFVLVIAATTGKLRIFANNAYSSATSGALTVSQWNHVEIANISGTFKFFINGTLDATTTTVPNITSGGFVIGKYADAAAGYLDGWTDEYRVSKGIARHTDSFTPPITAYCVEQSLSGVLTSSGNISKSILKILSGILVLTGIANKLINQAVNGTLVFTGNVTKTFLKTLTGILTFTGNITKQINKALSGTLTQTGTLSKLIYKFLTGTLTLSGVVNKLIQQAIDGLLRFNGKVNKSTSRNISGNLRFSGFLHRLGWSRLVEIASSWTDSTKKTSTWTEKDKKDTTWTEETKKTTTWE